MRWKPTWVAEPPDGVEASEIIGRAEPAAGVLRDLGIRGSRFEAYLETAAALLANLQASSFEEGLKVLGELLGFEAVRPNGQADPDAAWRDGSRLWVITEAKTEERADTPLSADAVRQAGTHEQWVANVLGWERRINSNDGHRVRQGPGRSCGGPDLGRSPLDDHSDHPRDRGTGHSPPCGRPALRLAD